MNSLEVITLINLLIRSGVDIKATLDATKGHITPEDVRMSSDAAQVEVDILNEWLRNQ